MTGRKGIIQRQHYYHARRLEGLLMSIYSHPTTDETIKHLIKSEFYGSFYGKKLAALRTKEDTQ